MSRCPSGAPSEPNSTFIARPAAVSAPLDARWTSKVASLVATGGEARAITAHAGAVMALERAGGAPLRRVAVSTDLVVYSPTAAQATVLELDLRDQRTGGAVGG